MSPAVAPAPDTPTKKGGRNKGTSPELKSQQQPNNVPSSAASSSSEDPLLSSIHKHAETALMTPQVTLTCYVPTSSVGAVIGRQGRTIANIQRSAAQRAVSSSSPPPPVRVSIVGPDEPVESIPPTYTPLDWSSSDWTPVVIRAEVCQVLVAAKLLQDIVTEANLDDVILDLPIAMQKHAVIVGKKGLVLANLSADTNVRIMVPSRDVKVDIVQLEGPLSNVLLCCEKLLKKAADAPSSSASTSTSTAGGNNNTGGGSTSSNTTTTRTSESIRVQQLPSQTKLRTVGRKTECVIKKKKVASSSTTEGGEQQQQQQQEWLLTITGNTPEQVSSAVNMLQKTQTQQLQQQDSEEASPTVTSSPAPSTTSPSTATSPSRGGGGRGGKGGRGGRGGGGRGRNNRDKKKNTNSKESKDSTSNSSPPPSSSAGD